MPKVEVDLIDAITLYDAKSALVDNLANHIKRDTHPILRNQNTALLGICHSLGKMERDLELLHSKLQPILRGMSEDALDTREGASGRFGRVCRTAET